MPTFWILVAAMVLVAIVILVLPLMRRAATTSVARDKLNLAIHRERLAELKRLHEEGGLTAEEYDQAVLDLEADLADDLKVSPDQPASPVRGRWAAVLVAVIIPVVSVGLYLELGSSDQIPTFTAATAGGGDGQMPSIDQMVVALEQKLKDNPDQPEGWFMLGRSYLTLERYPEAAEAMRKANELQPGNPDLMVSYAQALALANGGDFTGPPAGLVGKVLEMQPDNPQGLFLAGVSSFQQGQLEQAVVHWRRVLTMQQPGSEDAKLLESYIGRATTLLAEQGKAPPAETAASVGGAEPAAGEAASAASLTVQVSLAPELAEKVKPTDTVFVFAVAANGPRMPLAIQRLTVAELPTTVTLDDTMAMMPAMKLSNFPQVTVGARVSFSGQAIAQSGDLEGRVTPVTVADAADPIPVVISTPVP